MNVNVIASGSGGNATVISDGYSSLLLDAGIQAKDIRIKSGWANFDGVFITHEHNDHSKAAKSLAKYGADVYASRGTFDALGLNGHRFHPMRRLERVAVGTFEVTAFDAVHDAAEPLGFYAKSGAIGENALYFCDSAYVKYTFSGLTHIIAECNYSRHDLLRSVRNEVIDVCLAKRIVRNHMSVDRLAAFLDANDLSRLKQVHLIHLSGNNSDADRFKQTVQRVTGTEVYVY